MEGPFLAEVASPRGKDNAESDDRQNCPAHLPRALVEHEVRRGSLNDAGALADPQLTHEQSGDAGDQ